MVELAPVLTDYLVVLALGGLVGFVEILSRYRDAPFKVAMSSPGLFYVVVNASVAAGALWTIRLFQVTFGVEDTTGHITRWVQVMVAGLGAMAIFRSSLFFFNNGDADISIGPNAVLQILLSAIDKEVDRQRGQKRAHLVENAMKNITYTQAVLSLPTLSIALMQNLSIDDQNKIITKVESLANKDTKFLSDSTKKLAFGLAVMDVVGEDILNATVKLISEQNDGKANDEQANDEQAKAIEELEKISSEADPSRSEAVNQFKNFRNKVNVESRVEEGEKDEAE